MNAIVDEARLAANWRSITAELDAPRAPRLERALRRVGVPARLTRLVAATPALRRAFYIAVVVVAFVGVSLAQPDDRGSTLVLLLAAPLLPVLGVAMAFGVGAGGMHETELATPWSGVRLVALRALTVLAVAVAVVAALAVLSPATRAVAAAWLLPALAVTAVAVAAMTWLAPRRAATLAGAVWVIVVLVARAATERDLAAFGALGQLVALVVAACAAATIVVRRESFDRLALGAGW